MSERAGGLRRAPCNLLVSILVGTVFITGCDRQRQSSTELEETPPEALASLTSFLTEREPQIAEVLQAHGYHLGLDDQNTNQNWMELLSSETSSPEEIERGTYWVTLSITVHTHHEELGFISPEFLSVDLVTLGHDEPWTAVTEDGYLTGLAADGDQTQGFPPEVHVDLLRVFGDEISFMEWLTGPYSGSGAVEPQFDSQGPRPEPPEGGPGGGA